MKKMGSKRMISGSVINEGYPAAEREVAVGATVHRIRVPVSV